MIIIFVLLRIFSSPSLWRGLSSPVLAAVVLLGCSGRHLIQIIVAIPRSRCGASGPQAPGPSCYLGLTVTLLSVNIHYLAHIITGSVMFVLLPKGVYTGAVGPI